MRGRFGEGLADPIEDRDSVEPDPGLRPNAVSLDGRSRVQLQRSVLALVRNPGPQTWKFADTPSVRLERG